jgi:hypothetical protein
MAHLIKKGPLNPSPGEMQSHPWRFTLGQSVYLAGRPPSLTYLVTGGFIHNGFPHLLLSDSLGNRIQVPQLCASSKPIVVR